MSEQLGVDQTREKRTRHLATAQPAAGPHETSLEQLLRQRYEQLMECHELLAGVRTAVSMAVADSRGRRPWPAEPVLRLNGQQEIVHHLLTLTARAERELLTMHTRPDWPVEVAAEFQAAEIDALQRGVTIREVLPATMRYDNTAGNPQAVAKARPAQGGPVACRRDVRVADLIPADIVTADHRVSLILLTPGALDGKALLVNAPALTRLAADIFERVWAGAGPPRGVAEAGFPALADATPGEVAPSDQERRLLQALSLGAKDETAARQLGVSVRTARRMIAQLMRRLDARSRFQAGATAVQKGWL
jgi:DNA-binding CsgD family transcriptional regulator/sugar-specific transcriptional regulator TrmB